MNGVQLDQQPGKWDWLRQPPSTVPSSPQEGLLPVGGYVGGHRWIVRRSRLDSPGGGHTANTDFTTGEIA